MIIGISGKKQHGKDTIASIIQYLTHQYEIHGQIYETYEQFLNLKYDQDAFDWKIKKFADKVKDIVCLLIGCTREQLEDNVFKETPLGEEWRVYWYLGVRDRKVLTDDVELADGSELLTPRKLLQLVGTDCGRKIIHPNIWVNATMADYKPINNCQQHSDGLFYTDEHGENEVTPIYPKWIIPDVRFPNEVKAIEDREGFVIRVTRKWMSYEESQSKIDTHESEISLDTYQFDIIIINSGTIDDLIQSVEKILMLKGIIT